MIYAVDLDGTLAHYNGWVTTETIGEPILPMVEKVKFWISEGITVRIFTARVSINNSSTMVKTSLRCIEAWCLEHIGAKLEITADKGMDIDLFFDDRAIQVFSNTGETYKERLDKVISDLTASEQPFYNACKRLDELRRS